MEIGGQPAEINSFLPPSGDWTLVCRLGSSHLYLWSRLSGPKIFSPCQAVVRSLGKILWLSENRLKLAMAALAIAIVDSIPPSNSLVKCLTSMWPLTETGLWRGYCQRDGYFAAEQVPKSNVMSVLKKEGTSEYSDPPGEGHMKTEILLSQEKPWHRCFSIVPREGTTSQTLSCVTNPSVLWGFFYG